MLTINRRQGVKSRQIMYPEPDSTFGQDATVPVGYIMPLADESGFGTDQGMTEAPVFKGNRKAYGIVYDNIMASGESPYGLEFRTFLRVMRQFVGPNGYVRPGGGVTSLHRISVPTANDAVPGSVCLQDESLETPVQYIRNRGVRAGTINLSYANAGVARYGVGWTGIGDEVQTSLAGTVNDDDYKAASYFNGYMSMNGYDLVGLSDFSISFDGGVSRGDAAFREGIGSSVDFGVINVTGSLGLQMATNGAAPENNLNYYNMAVNQQSIPIDVAWANDKIATADQWCRIIIPGTKFSRRGFRPGGSQAKSITQDWRVEQNATTNGIAAEKFGTIRGPYNIGAGNAILGVQVNGGATIPITLVQGAARTVAQVVTDINANATFTALGTASVFMGRVMLRSLLKSSSASMKVDTAQATSAHTVLGFDGILFSGKSDTEWLMEFYNDITTDLATTV